ncbi:lyase family protein, partial [Streptomyces sp. NPDC055094]
MWSWGVSLLWTVGRWCAGARQVAPWHTDRVTIAELATTLGIVAGAVSKPATDITVMASTELSEVAESAPGGSSAMPHKQ